MYSAPRRSAVFFRRFSPVLNGEFAGARPRLPAGYLIGAL